MTFQLFSGIKEETKSCINLRLFFYAGIWPTEGGVVHAMSLIVARSPHCRLLPSLPCQTHSLELKLTRGIRGESKH